MLLVPVVGHMVVHGNLFPDPVCQKAHGIFVPGNDVVDYDILSLFLIGPEILQIKNMNSNALLHKV